MQSLPKHRLLEYAPNPLEDIRKIHNLEKPGRVEEAIAILEEWIQKQEHFLKKDFSREYLERCILTSKGSIEKTKKQLDALCTMKTMLPQFFNVHNVKEEIKDLYDAWSQFPLPKLTNDYYRIFVYKLFSKSLTEENIFEFFKYNICASEYMKAHDYVNGFVLFYDLQRTNFTNLLAKLNPVVLQQYTTIVIEGYGVRLKGIHLLTDSKAVDLLVKMIKQFLSPKISKRIYVHKNLEQLHKVIPKDLLPSDHGGKEKSSEELHKAWIEELSSKEHVSFMKMMSKAGTDEKLRRTDKFNESYMGMPGSFRNLKVD